MYKCSHMKFVNHYNLISFESIAGLVHMVKRDSIENYGILVDPILKNITDV
ncbi:hypothetical protein RhiirA1_478287 [Rhizophagus irregularis]|uniref:Uncharacterized protein n=1 Tax=Rhizophagus irregularis TaxID=588596 RepID=A0A2N0QS89_9GLOM|nr:hypothetical protein RhiirA1_478287 [Rhizophagus irregularis]GET52121.1 hypothetical protein GLOIN_2v1785921 [Rhizophagus irregularis DAOM 181602=DAOM 197198]